MSDPPIEPYWRLLAIGIDPDISTPELYGAIHEGEEDIPLMVDGRLALFTDPARAPELIRQHGGALASDKMDVQKPSFWCDVAKALHLLSAGGVDTTAVLLDAINVLLDLVKASGIKMVEGRRRALHDIANYCTTNKDITKYLEEEGDHSSRELIDAVLWCVGAVVVKARIV